ncbi:hypothetical protein Y032_0066g3699 [Ancylostoma ceylanicum]|uniref:Receptor ligand binding region domain-containing protein n=1 Tax=Ancylostoma ceylanicum TaxID=53326 RepID=A0A016TZV7_9BILA|nr:hypothetical protein Y032_0066g3699 [Ancylostoma ceylanicum]
MQACDPVIALSSDYPDRLLFYNTASSKPVTVGIIAAEHLLPQSIAWSLCGGSVGLALDKLREEYNLDDFDFRFLVGYSECDLAKTLGLGIEYLSKQQADVVIGPPCSKAGVIMAHLSNIYQAAWMGWGYVISPELALADKYPFVTTLIAPSQTIGISAVQLLSEFNWDIISILYTSNDSYFCDDIIGSFMDAVNDPDTFTPRIAVKQVIDVGNNDSFTRIMEQVQTRSRGKDTQSCTIYLDTTLSLSLI